MSSVRSVAHGALVWVGKPWVIPIAIIRTITVVLVLIFILWFESAFGFAFTSVAGLPIFVWTVLIALAIWLVSLLDLLIFWATNTYVLRQDGLEIKRGIIRLHSFVITPSGFGDLSVYQSISGRIFGYGDLTVTSQGERKTKLALVRSPFSTADTLRDVMGKPLVRVENHV